ncbi:MAG TPA: 5'-methylthioadenosine/adenosylhomocysteine nucleosidase [Methylibium sp.]
MTLAIVAAMHEELRALLPALQRQRVVLHAGREFHCGRLDGQQVVLVLSRIGKVAAATTAALLIERFGVRRLLFTGVAGGLGAGVKVGDVVVARELLQHDMDASPLFARYEVPLTGRARFATDAVMSDALLLAAREGVAKVMDLTGPLSALTELGVATPQVHEGLVLSGDRFVATEAEGEILRSNLSDALAVEMEGAAVAQVCHDCDIPFAVLRSISDRADDSAHVDFGRFVAEVASRYSATIVRSWLRQQPGGSAR